MARREWPLIVECGHDGCRERVAYRYQTRRDLVESFEAKNFTNGRWRCVRHSRSNEVLSEDNPKTTFELTSEQLPSGLYFGGKGFVYGPGFKAFAEDFPPGTKLIVSAAIVLPFRDSDGNPKGEDSEAASSQSDDSAGRKASPETQSTGSAGGDQPTSGVVAQ